MAQFDAIEIFMLADVIVPDSPKNMMLNDFCYNARCSPPDCTNIKYQLRGDTVFNSFFLFAFIRSCCKWAK